MPSQAYHKLQRVDRQMKLYGLTPLQREVVHKLFIDYVKEVCQQAEKEIIAEMMTEHLTKGQVH